MWGLWRWRRWGRATQGESALIRASGLEEEALPRLGVAPRWGVDRREAGAAAVCAAFVDPQLPALPPNQATCLVLERGDSSTLGRPGAGS